MQTASLAVLAVLVALQARPAVFEVASVKPFTDSVLILSGITTIAKGRVSATAMTLKELVASSYRARGQAVIGGPEWVNSERYNIEARVADEAGEAGSFADLKLEWEPDETQFADWGRGVYARPVSDPSGPSLFTAVQEQLGLRLDPARAPIEVIVIDAAERPTAD